MIRDYGIFYGEEAPTDSSYLWLLPRNLSLRTSSTVNICLWVVVEIQNTTSPVSPSTYSFTRAWLDRKVCIEINKSHCKMQIAKPHLAKFLTNAQQTIHFQRRLVRKSVKIFSYRSRWVISKDYFRLYQPMAHPVRGALLLRCPILAYSVMSPALPVHYCERIALFMKRANTIELRSSVQAPQKMLSC